MDKGVWYMKYTRIVQNEDKSYSIYFDDDFYTIFYQYYEGDSYFNIVYRLFGLLPQDFYHYVGATYNAYFKPSKYVNGFIYTLFKEKKDAIKFANEIDKRIDYCVKRGDFN